MSDLPTYLSDRRARVDAFLDRYLQQSAPDLAPIVEAMRYSVFAGGKRLRPILALAAAETVGGLEALELALPAACALEMIHTYSLVHDDLPAMDNDTLRRGRATAHVVYGEGMAILSGDGLLTEAFGVMAQEPAGDQLADRKLRAITVLARAAGVDGMVGGQAIDLQAEAGRSGGRSSQDEPGPGVAGSRITADGLRAMHARKTGALIRASALLGGIMAGGSTVQVDALGRYGTEIGLAFQIVDDILDVEGAAGDLGKTAGKDAAAGKPTYPAFFGIAESRRLATDCIIRSHQVLAGAGLEGRLGTIADWVVGRKS